MVTSTFFDRMAFAADAYSNQTLTTNASGDAQTKNRILSVQTEHQHPYAEQSRFPEDLPNRLAQPEKTYMGISHSDVRDLLELYADNESGQTEDLELMFEIAQRVDGDLFEDFVEYVKESGDYESKLAAGLALNPLMDSETLLKMSLEQPSSEFAYHAPYNDSMDIEELLNSIVSSNLDEYGPNMDEARNNLNSELAVSLADQEDLNLEKAFAIAVDNLDTKFARALASHEALNLEKAFAVAADNLDTKFAEGLASRNDLDFTRAHKLATENIDSAFAKAYVKNESANRKKIHEFATQNRDTELAAIYAASKNVDIDAMFEIIKTDHDSELVLGFITNQLLSQDPHYEKAVDLFIKQGVIPKESRLGKRIDDSSRPPPFLVCLLY